ncbi:MAG: hypothetical protein OHK93_006600 [Ramalina farinacea]|uniref:AAA+ ATPase domain-containing protein n=1 Tax=Ramalina farinacea TaxID=258253 RepID=A0AA43QLU0_9LECA|nr:hypothetical protein [Ramalina farinacea]
MPALSPSPTSVAITNPLILYRTLVQTKHIEPDPAQHRLAIHLQNLYHRLKDYQPEEDYGHRLRQLQSLAQREPGARQSSSDAPKTTPGILAGWRARQETREATALTRRLTDHESALHLQSPQGLMLHGHVGTGKSLLIDLLADSLPTQKKRRWHFNTFMLETFAKLEALRKNRLRDSSHPHSLSEEHSLLTLARDTISTSPIMFLDEFQMPDRAASKILSNFLTSFFHLGGVLIATSNRMPEELGKASGVEFSTPASGQERLFGRGIGLFGRTQGRRNSDYGSTEVGDSAKFLDVLRARCEVWEMEGSRDWRRREADDMSADAVEDQDISAPLPASGFHGLEEMSAGNVGLGYEQSLHVKSSDSHETMADVKPKKSSNPRQYFVKATNEASPQLIDQELEWLRREHDATGQIDAINGSKESDIDWQAAEFRVYGRKLLVHRCHGGVTKWTFNELLGYPFGPADYLTLASSFHTFILVDVPILTFLQKNEARRFITLLDALYEARCKLLIQAEAGPDDIFFPEAQSLFSKESNGAGTQLSGNEIHSETVSEVYQDQTSPFRPNISSYSPSASFPSYASSTLPTSASQASLARSILANEDSDFGPIYGAGRSRGISDGAPGAGNEIGQQPSPNFAEIGAFTGEDERFAYRRARSRIWEMCGTKWWARQGDWWKPLSAESRPWEGAAASISNSPKVTEPSSMVDQDGAAMFRHGASPFRTIDQPPPKFSWTHAWGMMTWGPKAGKWGQGPAGLTKETRLDQSAQEDESKSGSRDT